MCMACGLIAHDGEMKQYARNSSNSRDAMENAYMISRSGESTSFRPQRY